jgi:hypothetical protein
MSSIRAYGARVLSRSIAAAVWMPTLRKAYVHRAVHQIAQSFNIDIEFAEVIGVAGIKGSL